MPTPYYESRRLYSLHIFKDTPGSNWENPTVHILPLSSKSAQRFSYQPTSRLAKPGIKCQSGSRDGVINLYRLPSDQISFLERYLANLNEEIEKKKEQMTQDWKTSTKQAEKEAFEREMKRNAEKTKSIELKRQYLREKAEHRKASSNDKDDKVNNRNKPRVIYSSGSDYEGPGRGRGYYPAPPPPPRHYPMRSHHPRYVERPTGPSPALLETLWAIEDVELSFIPETIALERVAAGPSMFETFTDVVGQIRSEARKSVRLDVATNKIAPESFSSFAVVLSRCTGVEVPNQSDPYIIRSHSPVGSYRTWHSAGEYSDSDEIAEERTTVITPAFIPPPLPPQPTFISHEQQDIKEPVEGEEEGVETESKAGEAEDGSEDVVYVKDLKKQG